MSDSYQASLRDYVEKAKASGMSYDEVRQGLISGGWDAAMVDQMLPEAFGQPAAAPVAPVAAAPPAQPPAQAPAYTPPVAPVAQPPAAYAPPVAPVAAPPAAAPGYPPVAAGAGYGQNTSGQGPMAAIPAEVEAMGWSWGGFGLNWIWGIGNKTMIALLALIPCVNIGVAIWLGISGHKLAWQNRRFEGGVPEYQATMKAWNTWGLVVSLVSIALNIVSGIIQAANK